MALTRVSKENVLDRVEGWSPGPIESHHHEHEALCVERSPTEEESEHDNHCQVTILLSILFL